MSKSSSAELERLGAAQAAFEQAQARRDRAILAAVGAGIGLRRVADVANCSHESIRRIVVSRARIMFVLEGAQYPVSFHQAEELAGQIVYWGEVESGTSEHAYRWRTAALGLAADIRSKLAGDNPVPIPLDRDRAFALYQTMLLDDRPPARGPAELAEGLSWLFRR